MVAVKEKGVGFLAELYDDCFGILAQAYAASRAIRKIPPDKGAGGVYTEKIGKLLADLADEASPGDTICFEGFVRLFELTCLKAAFIISEGREGREP